MDLKQLLFVVMAGIPAGVIEYIVLDRIGWYANNPDQRLKRSVAFAAAAGLGLCAWGIALGMGYLPLPVDARGVIEQGANVVIQVGLAAFGSSQAVHMRDLATK